MCKWSQVLAAPIDVDLDPGLDMEAARGIMPEEDERELLIHEEQRKRKVEAAKTLQKEWQEELGLPRDRSNAGSRKCSGGGVPPAASVVTPAASSSSAAAAPLLSAVPTFPVRSGRGVGTQRTSEPR